MAAVVGGAAPAAKEAPRLPPPPPPPLLLHPRLIDGFPGPAFQPQAKGRSGRRGPGGVGRGGEDAPPVSQGALPFCRRARLTASRGGFPRPSSPPPTPVRASYPPPAPPPAPSSQNFQRTGALRFLTPPPPPPPSRVHRGGRGRGRGADETGGGGRRERRRKGVRQTGRTRKEARIRRPAAAERR